MPATTRSNKGATTLAKKKKQNEKAVSTARLEDAPSGAEITTPTASPNSPVYFWRETETKTGWLSQWYPCAFTDEEGIHYETAEHYMMYQKAVLFSDPAVGAQILAASHPRQVKALGRKVKGFDYRIWNGQREDIVRKGTLLKFTRAVSEEGLRLGSTAEAPLVTPLTLRQLLLSTGDREIVEASPMDKIWGIGFGTAEADRSRGRWGLNLLGKALMRVRDDFKREDEQGEKQGEEIGT
ncbi:hypothetical protein B0T25DRAFT_573546 [Lasiosphaeria hispida]|uniref:NADAR domain-containing protein n=1 Tax=Lasiosphaeria hispida TaxID=260671 RepID=A0AAJ0M7W7_9PEZI|nr:hypothetical protein B0T25DRAFT_573546 [Lasiosphaeria hispida]